MSRASTTIGLAAAVAFVALAAAVLHAREVTRPLPVPTARMLSLRSGRLAPRLFLSYDALAADVYWMRTIQHYGTDRRSRRTTGRFELLQPLLDLVTTLDPHFNLAYRFGAIFLSSDEPDGPARPDLAVALLEKGLRANPSRWQYAEDIGFVNYWHTGNYEEAAHWFDRAAEMPGAPPWLKPLAAVTVARGGDRRGARQLLGELLSANEEYVRGSAARGLRQLDTLDEIDAMQSLVDRFRSATGADVTGWEDLVRARVVPGVPLDPSGVPLQYDAGTHTVKLGPSSTLAPLPQALSR